MHRFVTISTYARLCKINRESVYKRIKSGRVQVSSFCEHPLIDIEEYPPNRSRQKIDKPIAKRDLPDWAYG